MGVDYELHRAGERHIFSGEAPASPLERKLPPASQALHPSLALARPCHVLSPDKKQGRAARASTVRLHTSLAAQLAS